MPLPLDSPGVPRPVDFAAERIYTDGQTLRLTSRLLEIGRQPAGTSLHVAVTSSCTEAVWLLNSTGDILDGGPSSEPLDLGGATGTEDCFLLLSPVAADACMADITVSSQPVSLARPPQPQSFVLDFRGATRVELAGREVVEPVFPMDLPALVDADAVADLNVQNLDPENARAFLQEVQPVVEVLIQERLEDLFAPYDIQIVLAPAELTDPLALASTIYFAGQRGPAVTDDFDRLRSGDGGLSAGTHALLYLYGTAGQANDVGNRVPNDNAIVYVGTFGGHNLQVLTADIASLANALANCAAHEMGHLLGLQHVYGRHQIMGELATNTALFQLHWGRGQILDGPGVVAFAYQNQDQYLRRIVGGR